MQTLPCRLHRTIDGTMLPLLVHSIPDRVTLQRQRPMEMGFGYPIRDSARRRNDWMNQLFHTVLSPNKSGAMYGF
jgi:hypothetical protein